MEDTFILVETWRGPVAVSSALLSTSIVSVRGWKKQYVTNRVPDASIRPTSSSPLSNLQADDRKATIEETLREERGFSSVFRGSNPSLTGPRCCKAAGLVARRLYPFIQPLQELVRDGGNWAVDLTALSVDSQL